MFMCEWNFASVLIALIFTIKMKLSFNREFFNVRDINSDSECVMSPAVNMDFASSFQFHTALYFLWTGNGRKSMRRGMTNVLTLAVLDLKRLNIPRSFKETENGKENMFDFGQRTKQEKVFPLL